MSSQLTIFQRSAIPLTLMPSPITEGNETRLSFNVGKTFKMGEKDFYSMLMFIFQQHKKAPHHSHITFTLDDYIQWIYPPANNIEKVTAYYNKAKKSRKKDIESGKLSEEDIQAIAERKFYDSIKSYFRNKFKILKDKYTTENDSFEDAPDYISYLLHNLRKNKLDLFTKAQMNEGSLYAGESISVIKSTFFYNKNHSSTKNTEVDKEILNELNFAKKAIIAAAENSAYKSDIKFNSNYYAIKLDDDFIKSMYSTFTWINIESFRSLIKKDENTMQLALYLTDLAKTLHARCTINGECETHVSLNALCVVSGIDTVDGTVINKKNKSRKMMFNRKFNELLKITPELRVLQLSWVAVSEDQRYAYTAKFEYIKNEDTQALSYESFTDRFDRLDKLILNDLRIYFKALDMDYLEVINSEHNTLKNDPIHKEKFTEIYVKNWKTVFYSTHRIPESELVSIRKFKVEDFLQYFRYTDQYGNQYLSRLLGHIMEGKPDQEVLTYMSNAVNYADTYNRQEGSKKIHSFKHERDLHKDYVNWIEKYNVKQSISSK